MARNLSISVPAIGTFVGSSKKTLIAHIEQERDYWKGVFPDGMPLRGNNPHQVLHQETEYEILFDAVNDSSIEQLTKGEPTHAIKVFPPKSSAIGKSISILGRSNDRNYLKSVAFVLTNRLREAGAVPRNFIGGNEEAEMLRVSGYIETIATLSEQYSSTRFISEQEALVRDLVDGITDDSLKASEESEQLSKFVGGEVSRRRAETSRFRKLRSALVGRYTARGDELIDNWDRKFSETHDRYINKLQFEAPVKLWRGESKRHATRSGVALLAFVVALLVMIGFSILVVFWQGDAIAASFHQSICSQSDPTNCRDTLSAKGPLTVGAVLLIASLLLWLMKIFNRTYREAGQRAENAAERKSFVETYEAMMQSGQVPEEHRAIILNAIFRPSKDGQPVDDNNGLDVSAVSVASRILQGRG